MQLFFSTKRGDEPPSQLPSVIKFGDAASFEIWSTTMPISEFVDEVRALLAEGAVVSACVLTEAPPGGEEWLFFEWRGRLLVDLSVLDVVFREARSWTRTQILEDLNIAVFEPTDMPGTDFEIRADRYRKLLEDHKRGEIALRREWIETRDAQERLFGRYTDPKVGGAVALLSLSGAVSSGTHEFTLRTPAALGLDVDTSAESLVAKPIRDKLTIRCLGYSRIGDLDRADHFKTSRNKWANLHEEVCGVSPNNFFIALELDANIDPTIAIQRGAVFEQQTLIGVQTLAAAGDERTIVEAGEVKPLIIPAYCLNAELSPPQGQPMRPTPFVYRQATGTQSDVWRARRGF